MNKVKDINDSVEKLNKIVKKKPRKVIKKRKEAKPIETLAGLKKKGLAARRFLGSFMVDKEIIKK